MKSLKEALNYTLLDEAQKGNKPKVQVVNLPMIERDARIKAMKERFGASKFKRYDVDDFMKSKNEGFFFHYNPTANKYFEGNASFQFMFFKVNTERELSSPPDIDDYWNHYNFKVNHTNRTITVEKQWIDSKLVSAVIDQPGPWKKAVEIAVERHPEIEDYKIKGVAGIKTVEELLALPTLDVAGKDEEVEVFISVTLSQAKKYLEDGIKQPFIGHLTFSVATSDARINSDRDPDGVWAILKTTVNGKNAKRQFDSLLIDQDIEPDEIQIVKTSVQDAMKRGMGRTYFKRYEDAWPSNTQEVILTASEDIDTILNTHKAKARGWTLAIEKEIHNVRVVQIPKKGGGWTLAIENKVSDTQVKDILAYLKVSHILLTSSHEGPIEARAFRDIMDDKLEAGDFEFFREWIFENNPPEKLAQGFMKWALDQENFSAKDRPMNVIKNFFPMGNWS